MNKVKKIICIALIFLMSMQNAYGFSDIKFPDESEIRESIESEYGIKIIINGYEQNRNVIEWLKIIDYSLEKFPEGVIREITDSNLNEGISTSIIFNRESNLMKIPVQYIKTDSSADIYINILYSGVYGEISSAYVELFMHEVSSMIGGYLLESYGHDNIKEEFEELNGEYRYGTWGDGYSKVFAGSHSAASVEDDLTDLIMTAELYPDKLNDVNDGSREIIHGKIELVSEIFDETFNSVTEKTKLYLETVPNEPDEWAKDEIYSMIESGLIPENMKLNYNSCITREDFAVLLKNAIKNKLGEENFYEYFKIEKPEANFILDPLNGEALIEDGLPYLYYDMHFIENKEDICDIYRIGLVTVSTTSSDLMLRFPGCRLQDILFR
jgi:hypothetical protein